MLDNDDNKRGVISMLERDKDRRFAPVKLVESYWSGLRVEGSVPLRSQIDPRGIEDALENAFLIERIASGMAKIRVAGMHVSGLMGMEVAGMPISSLITPSHRDDFARCLEQVFSTPSILRIELKAEDGFGKPSLDAHIELYPLRSDFGDITRALGVLVTNGRIGRAPRRFEIVRMTVTQLTEANQNAALTPAPEKASAPKPSAKPAAATPKPAAKTKLFSGPRKADETAVPTAMNKARADFARKQRDTNDRPHLRLVVSND